MRQPRLWPAGVGSRPQGRAGRWEQEDSGRSSPRPGLLGSCLALHPPCTQDGQTSAQGPECREKGAPVSGGAPVLPGRG